MSPAAIIPHGLNRFVFGKLTVAVIGIVLSWCARSTGRVNRVVAGLVAAGSVVLLVAAFAGHASIVSLLGRAPRYEGVLVIATYIGVLAASARLFGPDRDDRVVLIAMQVLAAVAILIAFIAILEAAGLRPLSSNVSRPGSLLGNASDEGEVGLLIFGPLAALIFRRRLLLPVVGVVAAALVVILSGSRGALIGLVVTVVVLALFAPGRRTALPAVGVLMLIAVVAIAVPSTRHRILDQSPLARHTVSGRELLWHESVTLGGHHVALGVGPSNFKAAIVHEHNLEWQQKVGPANPPDSPHDVLLQADGAGGIALLLVALALAAVVIRRSVRLALEERSPPDPASSNSVSRLPIHTGSLAAVLGYGCALLFHFTSPGPTLLACVLGGPLVSDARTSALAWRRYAYAAAFSLIALVFFLASIAEIALRSAYVDISAGKDAPANNAFLLARHLRIWDVDLADSAAHAFISAAQARQDQLAAGLGQAWLKRVPAELHTDEQVQLDQAAADELAKDYDAAETALTAVLAGDRDNPLVLLRRGVVEAENRQLDAAEADFKAASSVDPTSADPWNDLAVLYNEEGRTALAQDAHDRASKLDR